MFIVVSKSSLYNFVFENIAKFIIILARKY